MAVELRCPECRSKLRLAQAPEPDSEIECPKCRFVFDAEDNIVKAVSADDHEKAAKKKSVPDDADDEDDAPKKKNLDSDGNVATAVKKKDPPKAADQPFKRKKRRAKKKKTNPYVLYAVIGGCFVGLLFVAGVMAWTMSRKTVAQEMMSYLPDDCDELTGVNLGHLQKYPEFYKTCEATFSSRGFKKAAEALATGLGVNANEVMDYVIQGEGTVGGKPDGDRVEATVFRTKNPFDAGLLSKIAGAKEYSANGVKYYTINEIPELGYSGVRVFAPTNRIVVFCPGNLPDNKFKAMLNGNKENPDGGVYKRGTPLIKQVSRGTVWMLVLYGRSIPKQTWADVAPAAAGGAGGMKVETDEDALKKEVADMMNGCKGMGLKASVGSRDVRGEFMIWYKDSDAASNMAKKWKDKDWVKDDEKPAPRWWGTLASKSAAGKTAANALKDTLSFNSSGEIFSVRVSMGTELIKGGVGQIVNTFNPKSVSGTQPGAGGGGPVQVTPGQGGPGGGPGRPGGGPGRPGGGPGTTPPPMPGQGPGGNPPGKP